MELVQSSISHEYYTTKLFNYYNNYPDLLSKYKINPKEKAICGVCFRELHVRFNKYKEISMKNLFINKPNGICFLVHEQCKKEIREGFFDNK